MLQKTKIILLSTLGISAISLASVCCVSCVHDNKSSTKDATQSTKLNNNQNSLTSNIKPDSSSFGQTTSAINQTFSYQNLNYEVQNGSTNLTLLGFSNQNSINNPTTLTIPNSINYNNTTYYVTSINASAFYNANLSEVIFNTNLLNIGALAFANNNLTDLILPSGLQNIGNAAFINNPFNHGTTIYLGPNTQWNKQWNLCPFGSNNNYGCLVSGVQTVVQNLAVYNFQADQYAWVITSYLPSVAALNTFSVVANNKVWTRIDSVADVQQAAFKPITSQDDMPSLDVNGLNNYAIYFVNAWNNVSGAIVFNTQTQEMNVVYGGNYNANGASNQGVILNSNASVTFNIYNTISNQNVFSKTINGDISSSQLASDFGTVKFSYGDMLTISYSGFSSHSDIFVASNYNASCMSNNNTKNSLNTYMNLNNSWSTKLNETCCFRILEHGLIHAQIPTLINPINSLSDTNTFITVSGTSIANQPVSIDVDNGLYSAQTITNSNGAFSVQINVDPSKLSTTDYVQVSVDHSVPISTHLLGLNPINTGIFVVTGSSNNNPVQGAIVFDGVTGTLQYCNLSSTLPSFTTSFNNYATNNLYNGNETLDLSANGNVTFIVTNPATKVQSDYNVAFTNDMTLHTLANEIATVKFQTDDTLTIDSNGLNSDFGIFQVMTNNNFTPYGYQWQGNDIYWSFATSLSGITNLESANYYKTMTGNFCKEWVAGDGWIATNGGDGWCETGGNAANWDNPSPLFISTVHSIVSGYSNDYDKALAIEEWVNQNMHYTFSYTYGHTIEGTFEHLEGICGNFANLATVMLQQAGIVSRVVIGYALSNTNLYSRSIQIDHAWTQAWIPSLGEWITLDPTWGWFAPIGHVEDAFNLCRCNMHLALLMWPANTNYFSYFHGHEYDALNNLGRYFCVQPGINESNYPMSYAAGLSALLNAASNLQPGQLDYMCQW